MSDLRLALRQLARSPGFAFTAVLTVALGIGLNTAMFSVLNAMLLRPLSFPHTERLFVLDRIATQNNRGSFSAAEFADVARDSTGVAELTGYRSWGFNVSEPNKPADFPNSLRVSANFFTVLGVHPERGRSFFPEEDAPGKNNVVVIGHQYWQSRFDGAADIVGRTIRLDDTPVEIVGVMPASLDADASRIFAPIGIYRPMGLNDRERADRKDTGIGVYGRYTDAASPAQAAAQFDTIAQRLAVDHPAESAGVRFGVRSLQSITLTGVSLRITWLLVGLSGFVLLIACSNLANLLLARALSRAREFSVRAALGASRVQLVRPLVVECLLLTTVGGALALLVSQWITDWMTSRLGSPTNPLNFSADSRVIVFMLLVSTATVLLFGVGPAWWVSRTRLGEALKSGARGATDTLTQQRYRQLLIVTQFALALVLLSGAAFFLRGVQRYTRVGEGWDPSAVVSGAFNSPVHYSEPDRLLAFHAQLREKLLAIPGVANATVAHEIPLLRPPQQRGFIVEGREPPPPGKEPLASLNGVSPGFFDTMGMRLVRGRLFADTDQRTSPAVVVINETMARHLFPGGDALGHRIGVPRKEGPVWAEIVGIVADVKPMQISPSPTTFQVYKPYPQDAWQFVTIAVRATSPAVAATLVDPIRQAVASLNPNVPVIRLMTVADLIDRRATFWRLVDRLLMLFAGLGLFLAAFGIYGAIARLVTQRTAEIGIRLALGAQVRDIMSLVLGNGMRMALVGAVAGVIGSVFLSHYLEKEIPVFGGDELFPIGTAAALLVLVALVASLLPARRAAKVDPMIALRAE
jgi:putative ABC transport system permease protein